MYIIGRKIHKDCVDKETGNVFSYVELWACRNANPDYNERGLIIEYFKIGLSKFEQLNLDKYVGDKREIQFLYNRYGKIASVEEI